jgi:signal transduction histidine kinase
VSATTGEHPPAPAPPGRRALGRSRPRRGTGSVLDRWPFRHKLNVLVIVPVIVVGALLGIGVDSEVGQAREASRMADLVRDSEQVARLINDIQAEHRQALLLSLQHESTHTATLPSAAAYRKAQRGTDAEVAAVRAAFGSRLPDKEVQALGYIRDLAVLRDQAERGYVPAASIDPAYASAVDYLIDGIGLESASGGSSSSVIALLDTVLRANAAHAAFESAVFSAQTRDANALTEFSRAVGAQQIYDYQAAQFGLIATPRQVMSLDGIRRSAEQTGVTSQFAELQIDPGALQSQSPQQLRQAMTDGERQAEARLRITRSLIEQIAAKADAVSAGALKGALLLLGLALLGFTAWLGFSVMVRRSVVRPLAALTGAAQQVVEVADEELARIADDEDADSTPLRPRSIPVPVRDEVGELAETFNRVQVTAAALLERQVLSRRNVAEMFGNVGRRVSNLTTRQLMLIDAVEREETDPELLNRLYRIDHIAVRLQRNADSLMLLAGIRETGVASRPTSLANVIRAGLGQIEGFQRVSLRAETEFTVVPDIIGDLTLILAELLENAVAFSPSESPVEVVVRPGTDVTSDGGALIEVIDHGLGLSTDRLAEENARLIRRERLDLVPTKVLGLFVVGTLARRWDLRVSLSRTPGGGVTSTVWVPPAMMLTADPVEPPSPAAEPAGAGAGLPSKPGRRAVAAPPVPSPATAGETAAETPWDTTRDTAAETADAAAAERRPTADPVQGHVPRLPRRVPAQAVAGQPTPDDGGTPATPASRPLRRRVRGATLAMTTASADARARDEWQPVDAHAVRSELDEFEAAVLRAERDSVPTGTPPAPALDQEPTEESGSDHVDR